MKWYTALLIVITMFATGAAMVEDSPQQELSEHLKPLAPYVGKTWKGEFAGSTPDKPVHDVARWERALNGTAIRIIHSVNDGQYGGESIIVWDAKKKSLVSWYFTTAGFYTQATLKFEDGKLIAREAVTGNQNGITEVQSTSEILPGGRMTRKARFLRNGKWVDGHEIHYKESPDAKVVFR